MNQLKLPDLYIFHLLKLYYKLYRNKLPPYFENFIPQYGAYHQNLRNSHIRLPAIGCEFEKNNSKYQMHFRLRELANPPSNPPLYLNIDISDDILSQSLSCVAKYVQSKYISSYYVKCNVKDCYTCICNNSWIQIAYSSDIFVDALLSIQILYWSCHVEQHG